MAKYYLYISDQKVDMLLTQISTKVKHNIASELNLNIGILSARIKSDRVAYDDRIHRLLTVDKYLKSQKLGSLDNPGSWIYDTCDAYIVDFEDDNSTVFFVGNTEKSNFIMGGSAGHLISRDSPETHKLGRSHLKPILSVLRSAAKDRQIMNIYNHTFAALTAWPRHVEQIQKRADGPAIRIEFLAKKLALGEEASPHGKIPIIATPLYVAMAD